MLDLAAIEAGRLRLEAQAVALAPLRCSVASLHEGLAKAKGLKLSLHLALALPLAVLADPQRLRQMLGNLMSNAAKFAEHGRVEVMARPRPGGLRLMVSDTGPGIPAAFLPHLFEAFRQGDTSARRAHGGTGLGMAIVPRLALAMGGELHAHFVEGRGSTFPPVLATAADRHAGCHGGPGPAAA